MNHSLFAGQLEILCGESPRCAQLCNLRISDCRFGPFVNAIPLSQLTHLSAEVPCDAFYNLLGQMPNLVDGDFRVGAAESRTSYRFNPETAFPALPAPSSTPLVHNIQTLCLGFEERGSASLWNRSLKLPKLRHLKLVDSVLNGNECRVIIDDLCQGEVLESLKIGDIIYSADAFRSILRRTPRLSKLSFGNVYTNSMSVTPLTGDILQEMASGALLPELETLECRICVALGDKATPTLDQHLDMLEGRRKDTTPARHIANITFVSDKKASPRAACARLDKMKEETAWNIAALIIP
ncbi:hypothetical protein H0H81_006953 [Sphagnurus paluster]|uniref:Uncharacterized protein n=1 Tax=Sphagnurus paluster TaxID=117069 RepID=A0A9P7K4N8_9AGAR|nr:hypothetical protein H0H81_006953 [Sphagnurus paluster]